MVLTRWDVEQDRLTAVPTQVWTDKVDQPDRGGNPFDGPPASANTFGVDRLAAGIDMPMLGLGIELIDGGLVYNMIRAN
jgi:hypothetical protein